MKKTVSFLALALLSLAAKAGNDGEIIKTGYNFGPLPAVAYDADKGFQLGAILQIFNYGDGHNYPNYDSKLYLEASFFTKGSQLYQVRYDNKELIPNVRWSTSLRATVDKAFNFYGFNGYQSYFDFARVDAGSRGDSFLFTPFYRYHRNDILFKSDFLGKINDKLQWEAGVFAYCQKLSTIDYDSINKNKSEGQIYPKECTTLFDLYKKAGVISPDEAEGGFSSGFRAGLVYDTRDKEGAPASGIWAEGHITAALPGISKNPYFRYSLTFRHYVPIVTDNVLTFAYRLNYEGTFGSKAPFYALSYITNMGEKCDFEGMGGYNTVRGIMLTRVIGLDMTTYNAEFRWRFVRFKIGKQNIALALNAFSDGTMATRGLDISALKNLSDEERQGIGIVSGRSNDTPHITFGAGFRFIMNENFIVAAEYGMPLSHLTKNSPTYNQDGNGAFYVNIGYLF